MRLQAWVGAIVVGLSLCLSVSAAESLDIQKLWPTSGLYSKEQIGQLFYNITFRPFGRKDLTFRMLVLKDWKGVPLKVAKEQLEQEERTLLPLAELRAPDWEKSNATIYVRSVKITKKTELEKWVSAYLEGNGLTSVARRKGTFNGRSVDDVLLRSQQGEKTFLVRMTFSIHGSHIFLVTCAALEPFFEQYAKVFSIAAITFCTVENGK